MKTALLVCAGLVLASCCAARAKAQDSSAVPATFLPVAAPSPAAPGASRKFWLAPENEGGWFAEDKRLHASLSFSAAVGLRAASLAGHAVSGVRDWRAAEPRAPSWRGSALLVELRLGEQGRVFVRPSGTEPKLKIYVDWRAELPADAAVAPLEVEATRVAQAMALDLVQQLGLASG